jgi:hypothetical protein
MFGPGKQSENGAIPPQIWPWLPHPQSLDGPAQSLSAQKTEAKVACKVINIMTALGMPVSRRVA